MKANPSNYMKLIIHKVSMDAIPAGGGFADGVNFLSDKEKMIKSFREAEQWVKQAIEIVRTAEEPNKFKNLSDEEIASAIMKLIEEKKNKEYKK